MNDSVATCFALAAFIGGCGSDRDLVIGRNEIAVTAKDDGSSNDVGDSGVDDAVSEIDEALPTDDATVEATPCRADEIPPMGSLIHRYSFDGTGTMVRDSAGTADGIALGGASLNGSGTLTVDGNDDYVNLPNGLISSLVDATIVTWVSAQVQGTAVFERVFDFGNSTAGEDQRANAKTFVMVTPFSDVPDGRELTMQAGIPGMGTIQIATDRSIRDGNVHQVAAVFRSGTRIELYLDGDLLGTRTTRMKLSDIEDVNNWLGQSQFLQDRSNFGGSYAEVRIYGQALGACALRATLATGPDSLP